MNTKSSTKCTNSSITNKNKMNLHSNLINNQKQHSKTQIIYFKYKIFVQQFFKTSLKDSIH